MVRCLSLSIEGSCQNQESAGKSKRQATGKTMHSRLVYPGGSSYWRVKAQGTKAADLGGGLVTNNSLVIGTHVFKLKDPTIGLANDEPILAIMPKVTSSDHEAKSSKAVAAKPRDPKYTQPKWSLPGITKTQRRKRQRAKNREKAERKLRQLETPISTPKDQWYRLKYGYQSRILYRIR